MDHDYAWVSAWRVTAVPRWGQYQNCNGYPPVCLGASDFYVGHEAAQGLGLPAGGQCTEVRVRVRVRIRVRVRAKP